MLTSLALALFLGQANMGLTVPTPGVTPGPTYATNISNDLVIIDAHNHTPGNGVLVPTAGLNINANLPFNGFGATGFNSCTGTACGIAVPFLGTFVADAGDFAGLTVRGPDTALAGANVDGGLVVGGSLSADAGSLASLNVLGSLNVYGGANIDGGLLVGGSLMADGGFFEKIGTAGPISETLANTPLTLSGNAPATASNGVILNNITTLTSGNIAQFQNGGAAKGSIDLAGKFLSNPGIFQAGVITTTATLKGTAAAAGTATLMDGTVDVTGTGYITAFDALGTPEFAITGRGHLIPLSTAPTVGSLAGGWNSTGTVTGGDASLLVSITAGVGPSAIAANATMFIVTLNQAYASQSFTTLAQFCSSAALVTEVPIVAFPNANNQITVQTLSSFTPTASGAYKICITTEGAGAAN